MLKQKSDHCVIGVYSEVYNGLCSNRATDEELPMIRRLPSKLDHPLATCDRGIYMTVKWTQPEDDGGADISGYVIRYCGRPLRVIGLSDEDTDVDKYTDEVSVDGNSTTFQFTRQLNEYTSYQFAVAAVNAAGRGEFSEFTDYVNTEEGKYCCNFGASIWPPGKIGQIQHC